MSETADKRRARPRRTPAAANPARGEVSLELEGVSYVLRPSYEAIVQVERETGKSVLKLAEAVGSLDLPLAEAAIVATRFINAHGRATEDTGATHAQPQRIAELILESDGGVMVVLLALAQVLTAAATGGYTASGEVKAAKATTTLN